MAAADSLGLGITLTLRDSVTTPARKVGESLGKLKGKSEEGVSSLKKLQTTLNALAGSQVMASAKRMYTDLTDETRKFERQMAQVATQVDTSTTDMKGLTKSVEDMSVQFGTDAVEEAAALYEILSAGYDNATDSVKLLDVGNRMAIGGNASLTDSVDGLTTILNAWSISADKAESVADTLFTTVKLGKLNMDDLAKNIADVAPLAATLGIDLEQVGASIATMTKQGTQAPEAFTQMKAALSGMIRPTDELNAVWKKNHFSSAKAAIGALGYQGALQLVVKAAKGNEGQLQKLLGSVWAMNAVLQISGKNAGMYAESFKEVKEGVGAADQAFRKASATNDFAMNQAEQSWKKLKRAIGEPMLKALNPTIKKLTEAAGVVGVWLEKNPAWARAIGITVAAIVGLSFVLGGLAVALFIVQAVASPITLTFLLIAAAVAAVIAIGWLLYDNWDTIIAELSVWVMALGMAWDAFVVWLGECMDSATAAVGGWFDNVVNFFKGILIWISKVAMKFLEFLEYLPLAGDMAADLRQKLDKMNMEIQVSMQPDSPWKAMQKQAAPTLAYGGMSTFNKEDADILAVRNPSARRQAMPAINNVINVPKATITSTAVNIEGKKIADIVHEMNETKTVRN